MHLDVMQSRRRARLATAAAFVLPPTIFTFFHPFQVFPVFQVFQAPTIFTFSSFQVHIRPPTIFTFADQVHINQIVHLLTGEVSIFCFHFKRVFNSLAPWLQLDSLCFLFSFAFLISPFWHQQPIILNFCPSVISKQNSLDGGWFWSLGASIGTQLFLKQIMWATKQTKQTLWAQSDKHSYDTVTLPHLIFWNIKSIRPVRELHHEFLN